MTAVVLKKCVPVDLRQARWFDRQVGASIDACRFRVAPPEVELRTMKADGLARRAGDRAVCLSTHALFWTRLQLCETLIHEYAHRLIFEWELETGGDVKGHGPEFLLVLLALYRRVDLSDAHCHELVSQVNLYDFGDPPHCFVELAEDKWRGLVLAWAMEHCEALAKSPAPAEDLPAMAAARFEILIQRCRAWEADQLQVSKTIADLTRENQRLRNVVSSTKFAGLGIGVSVALLSFFVLAVAF